MRLGRLVFLTWDAYLCLDTVGMVGKFGQYVLSTQFQCRVWNRNPHELLNLSSCHRIMRSNLPWVRQAFAGKFWTRMSVNNRSADRENSSVEADGSYIFHLHEETHESSLHNNLHCAVGTVKGNSPENGFHCLLI